MKHLLIAATLSALVACRQDSRAEHVFDGASPRGSSDDARDGIGVDPPITSTVTVDGAAFSKRALLRAVAACTFDRARAFEASASTLDAEAQRLSSTRSADARAATLAAWREANAVWQELEVFQFGPAGRAMDPGGKGLRDQIYAWPLFSRCAVDEATVSGAYSSAPVGALLVNARGLAASEYLVAYRGEDNGCSEFSRINAEGSWARLGSDEREKRKLEYSAAVAADVFARAGALARAWSPDGENFGATLAVEDGTSIYASEHAALNAVSHALFYIDYGVKDQKVGRPVGFIDCFNESCPEAVESRYAKTSTQNIRQNLVGFRRIYQGCGENGAGLGFDDWLRAVSAASLADRMDGALTAAIAAAEAVDGPIDDVLASDRSKVVRLHAALKALTDLLKSEFVTVLNLDLPRVVEGDND